MAIKELFIKDVSMLNIDYIKREISKHNVSVAIDGNKSPRLGVKITFTKQVGEHQRELVTYPQKRKYNSNDEYINFVVKHFDELIP